MDYGTHETKMNAIAESAERILPQLLNNSVDQRVPSHIANETRIHNLILEQTHSFGVSSESGLSVSSLSEVQHLFQTIVDKTDRHQRDESLAPENLMLDASRQDAKSIPSKDSQAAHRKLKASFLCFCASRGLIQRVERRLNQDHVDAPFAKKVPFQADGLSENFNTIRVSANPRVKSTPTRWLLGPSRWKIRRDDKI